MAEYITKEQVIEWFRPYGHANEGIPFSTLKADVTDMPAADVAPVVHGRWVRIAGRGNRAAIFECLVCKKCEPHISNYCPNCGSKMDLGGERKDEC